MLPLTCRVATSSVEGCFELKVRRSARVCSEIGVRFRKNDAELITAGPCQHVGASHTALNARSEHLEDLVPDGMAERVVDLLEMVEIDQEEGDALRWALSCRPRSSPRVPVSRAGDCRGRSAGRSGDASSRLVSNGPHGR